MTICWSVWHTAAVWSDWRKPLQWAFERCMHHFSADFLMGTWPWDTSWCAQIQNSLHLQESSLAKAYDSHNMNFAFDNCFERHREARVIVRLLVGACLLCYMLQTLYMIRILLLQIEKVDGGVFCSIQNCAPTPGKWSRSADCLASPLFSSPWWWAENACTA